MIYTGRVRNGVVVLDGGVQLAEGTIVRVEPVPDPAPESVDGRARFMELAGAIDDLPSDLARRHNEYLANIRNSSQR